MIRPTIALISLLSFACQNDPECSPAEGPADELCLPNLARANQPLSIEARNTCGGCGTPAYTQCAVVLSGDTLTVTLSGQVCEVPDGVACSLACAITDLSCPVPALPPGTYKIAGVRGDPPQTLTVTASATATRCDLGAP